MCVSHSQWCCEKWGMHSKCLPGCVSVNQMCASTPHWFISCWMSLIHAPVHQDQSTVHTMRTIKPLTPTVLGPDSYRFFCTSCIWCCLANRQIKWLRFHWFVSKVSPYWKLFQTAPTLHVCLLKQTLHRTHRWFLGMFENVYLTNKSKFSNSVIDF